METTFLLEWVHNTNEVISIVVNLIVLYRFIHELYHE